MGYYTSSKACSHGWSQVVSQAIIILTLLSLPPSSVDQRIRLSPRSPSDFGLPFRWTNILYSMSAFTLDASGMFLCYPRNGDTLGFQDSLFLGPCNISELFERPGVANQGNRGKVCTWRGSTESKDSDVSIFRCSERFLVRHCANIDDRRRT